jgi:hypothetical protein
MLVIKNTENIHYNDIVARTKTTLQDLASGIKNLFRTNTESPDKEPGPLHFNNHLKSADEIEAEFRFFSVTKTEENNIIPMEIKDDTEISGLKKSAFHVTMNVASEILPEYMEENY